MDRHESTVIDSFAKYKGWFLHLLLVLTFTFAPYYFFYNTSGNYSDFFSLRNMINVLMNLLILFSCYLNYYWLIPRYFIRKRYLQYFVIILLYFSFLILPAAIIDVVVHRPPMPPFNEGIHPDAGGFIKPGMLPLLPVSNKVFLFLAGLFVTMFLRVNDRWKEVEKEKLNTELTYLKSRINPHFLFNTLNSIYGLTILENADKTGAAMLKLSKMMRYILTETNATSVALSKELSYLNDYVSLQKLRLDDSTVVEYTQTGDASDYMIAPVILIPFIENAFKYGINPDRKSTIAINIDIEKGVLQFNIYNKKVSNVTGESTGLGIDNAVQRLELMYPDRYQLRIEDTAADYRVYLKIDLL